MPMLKKGVLYLFVWIVESVRVREREEMSQGDGTLGTSVVESTTILGDIFTAYLLSNSFGSVFHMPYAAHALLARGFLL